MTMQRVYEQDGKIIDGGFLNSQVIQKDKDKYKEPNHFEQLGGWKTMTESFRRGNVFSISLWDDLGSNGPQGPSMAWLDSVYPSNSKEPGALRGRCDPKADRSPATLRRTVPNSQYTLSNLQVRAITSYPSISPAPVPSPSPKPPSPSPKPPSPSPKPPSPSLNPQPNPSSASRIRCSECVIEEL
jgi:U5 snRNP spliceosome subunit